MAGLLYNFFPTDMIPPLQLPINGDKTSTTQKQEFLDKRTINYNFFPTDLLSPSQLGLTVDNRDLGDQPALHKSAPATAKERAIKFKAASLQIKQVDSKAQPIVVAIGPKEKQRRDGLVFKGESQLPA